MQEMIRNPRIHRIGSLWIGMLGLARAIGLAAGLGMTHRVASSTNGNVANGAARSAIGIVL
jgi:hypothetical protein